MHRAVEYVLGLMDQAAGGGAATEEVRVPLWTRGAARVEAGDFSGWSGHDKVVQCKSSQSGDVTAPLLEAGCGSPAEIEAATGNAAGSILLVRNGSPHTHGLAMAEKIIAALDAGALGLIETSTNPAGLAQSNLGRSLGGLSLPSVGVSTAIGTQFREIAAEGGRVRILSEGEHGESDCHNVVVDIGRGDEILLLTAHLDTHDLAPGGFDNTSGVCAMLEALFALAPVSGQFKRRIRFIAFTGEEAGFIGSRAYVQQHLAELDEIVFQVNLDSVFPDTAKAMAAHFCRPAISCLGELFSKARRPVRVVDFLSNSSDYMPFALQGIPTARQANLGVSGPPWSHTIVDTADKADIDAIKLNAMVYAQLLLQLATTEEPFPARRLSRDEILAELTRWGAVEQWRRCEYLEMLRP
jgi:Zn-dependent M28 family amino/carboxypeptidase